MENNIALNMREIADKVNEEIENAKIARHRKEVETSIIPYIQEFAKKGKYGVDYSTPGYDAHLIRDILCEMGFTVDLYRFSHNIYRLVIRW